MRDDKKLDLTKLHREEYAAAPRPVLIEVGDGTYLTIEGRGAPGSEMFTARIGALYAVAFTIKMTRKFAGEQDYVIGKLEAQWWTEAGPAPQAGPREAWNWRLLFRTPDFVTQGDLSKAVAVLESKGKAPEAHLVRLERCAEGRCVQVLHVGPYERERETVAQMLAFAESQGLHPHGRHHEIYLSDPRRVPPERLRTILRIPVR